MKLSDLVKMRIILAVLSSILLYGQKFIAGLTWLASVGPKHEDMRWLPCAADALLLLAALVVLGFSFIRISSSADGSELCYDPTNPYWRTMKWFYGEGWGDRVSLCKSYWLTVFLIGLPGVALTGFVCFCAFVLPDILHDLAKDPMEALLVTGAVIGGLACGAAVIAACVWFTGIWKWLEYLWMTLAIAAAVGVIVVLPIYSIHDTKQVGYPAAAEIYSQWASIGVCCAALLALAVWGAFKYIPWLANTWIGKLLASFKKRLCPTLVACPCAQLKLELLENPEP